MQKALQQYRRRLKLSLEVHQAEPDNANYQCNLSIAYYKMGVLHEELGQFDKALNYHKKSAKLSENICQEHPENLNFKNALVGSLFTLADVFLIKDQQDEAFGLLKSSYKLAEEIQEITSENAEYNRIYRLAVNKLDTLAVTLGKSEYPLSKYLNELKYYQIISVNADDQGHAVVRLISAYVELAAFFERIEDWENAIKNYMASVKLCKQCTNPIPGVQFGGFSLGLASKSIAWCYVHNNDLENASVYFKEALDNYENVVQGSVDVKEVAKEKALVNLILGQVEINLQRNSTAKNFLDQSEKIWNQILTNDPKDEESKQRLEQTMKLKLYLK
jgi:tetratricopeptide (TPR) repeat protein